MADVDSIRVFAGNAAAGVATCVFPLPTATNQPVTQTRTRGRLPRSVGSLERARQHRRMKDLKRSEARVDSLREEVAKSVDSCEFDHVERQILTQALAVVEGKLRRGDCLFGSPLAVRSYLTLRLGGNPHEEFSAMFLDSQNRLVAFEVLFRGTLTQVATYPREVLLRALALRASSVILAHNHPSGAAYPSRADETLTQCLKAALALIDVRVLDHFIVTGGDCKSMAEMGLV